MVDQRDPEHPVFATFINMNYHFFSFSVLALLSVAVTSSLRGQSNGKAIDVWVTTPDKSMLLSHSTLTFSKEKIVLPVIEVQPATRFQTMDGFGFSLTGGSAWLINQKLTAAARNSLLRELFLTEQSGIGISYLRISIGASDLDDHVFSYDDVADGESDASLVKFNLDEDRKNLIPVLKQIIALQPAIKIMGSPWSAPAWMKTNQRAKGGSLKPEFYPTYAAYLVKYIQEMAREGITIEAITLQNEPENPNNTPSMLMTADEQNEFIKKHLGPAFASAGIKTNVAIFDHNCDHPEYPIAILNDAQAKQFIDGTAFHLYLGKIDALSTVHDAHPDKNIYFTEQWTSGKGDFGTDLQWHVKNLIVGATRNWSKTVLEWNLAADEKFEPHTMDGGCDSCLGALTIGNTITRNVSYYIIAHASRFVTPGSVRIASTLTDNLSNVAFLTPEGKKVLIVLNEGAATKTFLIKANNKTAKATLPSGSVGTFVWK